MESETHENGTNFNIFDISYTLKLKTRQPTPTKVRVVFTGEAKEDEVIKSKISLWITEDQTPYRATLTYLYRATVTERRAFKMWYNW